MDVTLIIPNYNGQKYFESIKETLSPYYDKGIEIILVDDGSSPLDKTVYLFRKFLPRVKIIEQSNMGLAAARNSGAKLAKGKFLQFLDIDDRISEDKIKHQINFAEENDFDIIYSDWQMIIINSDSIDKEPITVSEYQDDILYSLINGWWQPIHSYLINRLAYLKVKGSDPKLVNAQDFDLMTRLALAGFKFGYIPGNYSFYFRYINCDSLARNNIEIYWNSYDISLNNCLEKAKEYGLLNDRLKSAFANRWFLLARNFRKFNVERSRDIMQKIKLLCPTYYPFHESRNFKIAYTLFGYEIAEYLAKLKSS